MLVACNFLSARLRVFPEWQQRCHLKVTCTIQLKCLLERRYIKIFRVTTLFRCKYMLWPRWAPALYILLYMSLFFWLDVWTMTAIFIWLSLFVSVLWRFSMANLTKSFWTFIESKGRSFLERISDESPCSRSSFRKTSAFQTVWNRHLQLHSPPILHSLLFVFLILFRLFFSLGKSIHPEFYKMRLIL